jgi:oxygen-dependent protoporphyrinogen oxidase
LAALPEDELIRSAEAELSQLLDIRGGPVFQHVTRWGPTMPQYHVGHIDLVADVAERLQRVPGLHLAGNAYQGVGIPHCIHSGEMAASQVVDAAKDETARQRSANAG